MKSKKKYIVFASLVLALSAAVYINWQLSGAKTPQSAKELGAASYVSATASASDDEVQQTAALSNESKSYFSAERTKRQATQDKIIDDAKEIFNLESSSDADKSEAEKNVEELLKAFTIQDSRGLKYCQSQRIFRMPLLYKRSRCVGNCSEISA